MIHAIVAIDENGAIGRQGELLCYLPADMRHFKEVTMGNSIVMGRKTFESFPRRPLPGRQNIVITRDPKWAYPGVTVAHNLDEAIAAAQTETVFIIGGAQIYELALPRVRRSMNWHCHGLRCCTSPASTLAGRVPTRFSPPWT